MSSQEASSFRLVATLAVTGLLSGLVLVGVFLVTEPVILRNRAEAMERAIFTVLPGTSEITALVLSGEQLEPYESDTGLIPTEDAIFAGYGEGGALVGYAIPGEGGGFQDTIKLIYGFDPARRAIVGMQVLESKETPGLGDKIIFDEDFLANFVELKIEPEIVGVKSATKPRPSNEVDTITGATISSDAVISILNNSTQEWIPILDRSGAISRETGDDTPAGS
jgi:electron transport complex protein RnfG